MSIHPADIAIVVAALPMVAVGGPVEFNPVSAGILGAVIASMRKNSVDLQDATTSLRKGFIAAVKWLTTLMSGAGATVFGSPALCGNTGIEGASAVLVYFGVGLIGSTAVDLIISRDRMIAEKILTRFGGAQPDEAKK